MRFTLSPLFCDHAVLAANKDIRVFGSGEVPPDGITVSLNGQMARAEAIPAVGAGITWLATLPPMPCGGPYTLTVSGGGTVLTVSDIYTGMVILMAGQSNMQFKMRDSRVETPDTCPGDPLLRLFTVDRIEDTDKYHERDGWVVCEAGDVGNWTAIGWHTGRLLTAACGCAVGLVACYQGASVIESWIPAGLCPDLFVPPEARHIDHTYPLYTDFNGDGVLYEAMFRKLIPLSLSAAVWYQGESDTTEAEAAVYADELAMMIGKWRTDLMDASLPFVLIQLADFDPRDDAGWHGVQAAQAAAAQDIAHTALVVSRDVCETHEIHPATKAVLARRVADALKCFGLSLKNC